jgi:hypothetical protein
MAGQGRPEISEIIRRMIVGLLVLEATYWKISQYKRYDQDRIGSRPAAAEHWLIGEALPEAYQKHFGKRFGYSRNKVTGEISGPAIRFIRAILSLMKVNTPRDDKPFGSDAVEYYLR